MGVTLAFQRRGTIIAGVSGTGKSTLLRMLAASPPAGRVTWLFDPELEHGWRDRNGVLHSHVPNARLIQPDIDLEAGEDDGPCFDQVNTLAQQAFQRRRVHLVVDETPLCCRGGRLAPGWLRRVCLHGRKRNVSWVFCTQRPQDMPRSLTSQASEVFLFGMQEPADVEHFRGRGFNANDVLSLKPGEVLHWQAGSPVHKHTHALSRCVLPDTKE